MDNNNTGKYLRYAIGEIVLVVIGILIALGINNWNEKRKKHNVIRDLITVFQDELRANIESSHRLVQIGYFRDSIISRYKSNKITKLDVAKNRGYGLRFGTHTQQFIDDNLNEIISLEKELPESYQNLVPNLKELKRLIESQRFWERKVVEMSMKNKQELAGEHEWLYGGDSIRAQKYTQLILSDPIYKNKVILYNQYQLDENIWDASLIGTSAINILWEIVNTETDFPGGIDAFLKELDLKPMQQLQCDALPYQLENEPWVRLSFIMYNDKDEPVSFNYVGSNGQKLNSGNLTIEANSFLLGENYLSTGEYIEIIENEECNSIYGRSREDYIVIH